MKRYRVVLLWEYREGGRPKGANPDGILPYEQLPRTDFYTRREDAIKAGAELEQRHGRGFFARIEERGVGAWADKALEAAIRKKLPHWYRNQNGLPPRHEKFLQGECCPQCKQESLYCCNVDFETIDYDLRFAHICINPECDYLITDRIYAVAFPDRETAIDYCPFCEKP